MVTQHEYSHSQAEFDELHDLLRESYAIAGRPHDWLFARLENWKYANAAKAREDPGFFTRNVHLWRGQGSRLIGFCISEYGTKGIELQVHPHHRGVEGDMAGWILEEWGRGKEAVEVCACTEDIERQSLLARLGFREAGDDGYMRQYDVTRGYPASPLDPGFRVSTLAEAGNDEERIAVEAATFPHVGLDREWFDGKTSAPSYSADWDFVVVTPEGRYAAFCLAWLDRGNRVAEVDPVGTHPDFRRRGLARAVITECFRRLRAAGIERAYISSAPEPAVSNRLYESLAPTARYLWRRWVKESQPR